MNGFYKFAIRVLRVVMPLWYKLETEGLENVPEGSGYLFVSNHRSNADPILIGVQNPETQFCFLAKQELFSDGLVGWLLRKLGAVAVDRGAGDVTALEEIEFRLQNGQNALIFPEGTRSKDGKLGHFKTGAALIASQTGVPVVPVAISFDDELHFRSKVYVRYGAPFEIPKTTAADPEPAVLKQVRKDMTEHVAELVALNEQALAAERTALALPDFGEPEDEPEVSRDAEKSGARDDSPKSEARKSGTREETVKSGERKAAGESAERNDAADRAERKAAADRAERKDAEKKAEQNSAERDPAAKSGKHRELSAEAEQKPAARKEPREPEESREKRKSGLHRDFEKSENRRDEAPEAKKAEQRAAVAKDVRNPVVRMKPDDLPADDDGAVFLLPNPPGKHKNAVKAVPSDSGADKNNAGTERRDPEPVLERKNGNNKKAEERDQKMSKHLNENPAENDAEKDIVTETKENSASVTSELEDIISGVEKSADEVSEKVRTKKEKAEEVTKVFDETIRDAADDAADVVEEAADEDYDVDEEIRQAMMEDEAGMALPFKLRNPFKKKSRAEDADAEPAEDLPEDADDFAEDEKGGLFGGISLKNPFKKKDDYYDDEEFYEDDQDYDDMDDEDYDDEYDEEERHVDLGKIALILTFVILGIFAIDFGRRLLNDWKSSQGKIDLQSQESLHVDSMVEATTAPVTGTTAIAAPSKVTIEITTETTTGTTTTDPDATTTGTTFLDNRPTETLAVPNESKRSGCLALIDNEHQQVFTPNLLAFNQFPVEHLRMVSPANQKVDGQLAAPIKNMFNDFFAATGIGNVLVYNTTDTPAYPPYSISLPERSTGLTLDLAILNEAAKSHAPYTPDGNYAWLTEHACDYGFIVRYPANKAEKTGQNPLTWHFRYVGAPHAKYMYDNDLCLEEYLDLIVSHPWNSEHLTATVSGITYEMYYVPASETSATTEIQYPVDENGATPMISGDNINGFVVAAVRG